MSIDFPAAFEALTGRRPFRWQQRLFEEFARGKIPHGCDIPTGLGKTSVMAIWLAALDLRARNTQIPRRLVYVVDRRAVVDQATAEAETLARALCDGRGQSACPPIATLRERLRLDVGRSLPVSTLRGQLADNRAWLGDPSSPAVIVGTVDMIGSRLLFQGYGVSARMRPVHAALLGADALVVLDEAHLVPPFEALVRQIEEIANEDHTDIPFRVPRFRLLTLSATGRGTASNTFALQPEDEEKDDVVRTRLNAPKRLVLEPSADSDNAADKLAERAWERGTNGRRVIVFCDSRKVARAVYDQIDKKLEKHLKGKLGKDARSLRSIELIVGARRVREREELAKSLTFRRFAHKLTKEETTATTGLPAFLVATSAGEVGVDIDAEHMICDLVAWERMVQGLGRVNRLGEFKQGSLIDVFAVESDKEKEAETPAGAERVRRWRQPFESESWTVGDDGRRGASPGELRQLLTIDDFRTLAGNATTPEPLHPALARALLDAWSMTSLDEHPGRPDVAPWIRGWVDEEPQTQLLWRRHLPIRTDDSRSTATRVLTSFLEEAPPHLSEVLETYTYSVVDLLRARAKALLNDRKEGATEEPEVVGSDDAGLPVVTPETFVAVVLSPNRKVVRLFSLNEIDATGAKQIHAAISGRILILDARLGGLDETGLLNPRQGKLPATLDSDHVASTKDETIDRPWSEERLKAIGFCVRRDLHEAEPSNDWTIVYRRFVNARDDDAGDTNGTEWRVENWVGGGAGRGDPALTRSKQAISEHHKRAERCADEVGKRLAMSASELSMLVRASAVHDLGKMRKNWQAYAGNYGYPEKPTEPEPLAKFTKRGNPALLKIGELTYRHEFGSLCDATDHDPFDDFDSDARELALHVIAAHHGNARPVIAPVEQKQAPSAAARLAREAALRFSRLQKRWGPWGLAWWEALLRAVDVAASKEIDKSEGGN